MRIIANYNKISSISNEIIKKEEEILSKKELLDKKINSLLEYDYTKSTLKLVERWHKDNNEIETICAGIKYYADYMNGTSKNYNEIYDNFKISTDKIKNEEVEL